MGTVSSQLTRINDAEGSLTSVSVGGGAGAAANTDIFIQGAQSLGRRQSNTTLSGFLLDDGASNNISAAGTHVGMWIWHTHYAVLTALRVRIAANSSSTNYDEHIVPLTEYPSLGGWIRVWVDINRTADSTGGTGLDKTTARYFGPINSLPSVGGNAANLILDAIDFTTTGLSITGTNSTFDDFLTEDENNTTNKYGVVSSISGIIYCKARLTLGSSGTSVAFSDSGFTIVFPQQNLVSSNFMGITANLENASSTISLSSATISSPGIVKGDYITTGNSGSQTLNGITFANLRRIELTSTTTMSSCSVNDCATGVQGGATIESCTFFSTLLRSDNPGLVSDTSFTSTGAGDGHAIELLSTGEYSLDNIKFFSYGASGSTDAAIYNNSAGIVTLNIVGGGTTPTIRDGTSATTFVVSAPKTLTFTNVVSGSELRVFTAGTTGELYGVETTDGITDPAYVYTVTGLVDIVVHNVQYQYYRVNNYPLATTDASLPINQIFDRNYENP
jgi:hypothetical protein